MQLNRKTKGKDRFIKLSARNNKRKRTSGVGHRGSVILATSAGFITSIRTSCATRSLLPTRDCPLISNESSAWSFFFASFMTTSSASNEEVAEEEAVAERSAPRRASEERAMVISLFAFDWMR